MDFIDIFQHWSRSMGIAECGCVCVGWRVGGGGAWDWRGSYTNTVGKK